MGRSRQVADAYISQGGRTAGYGRAEYVDDLLDLTNFVVWAESDAAMFGGVRAADAFRAMCRLLDADAIKLRKIALGETP